MARRHYRRREKNPAYEIDVTTFLNLMVVLVPFLLITAVFSRLTIVELNLPSTAESVTPTERAFRLEVIVRDQGFEITNGDAVLASIPKEGGEYNLQALADLVLELKNRNPDAEAASVLVEPLVPYDYLIQVMDAVRAMERPVDGSVPPQFEMVALFPDISVGDAP